MSGGNAPERSGQRNLDPDRDPSEHQQQGREHGHSLPGGGSTSLIEAVPIALPPLLSFSPSELGAGPPRLPALEPPSHSFASSVPVQELNRLSGPASSGWPPRQPPVGSPSTAGASGYRQGGEFPLPSQHPVSSTQETAPALPFHEPRTPVGQSLTSLSSTSSQPVNTQWGLSIRQQPIAARACGYGERDRRVIDPPPIVEMHTTDRLNRDAAVDWARTANLVVQASLWDENRIRDLSLVRPTNRKPGGRLMGTMVASPSIVRDEHNVESVLFAFPDLSCRTYGNYTLRFTLMTLDPLRDIAGTVVPALAHVASESFTVFSASEFPGMRPSTALTHALKEQGVAMPIKKGKAAEGFGKKRRLREDDDSDDDEREQ